MGNKVTYSTLGFGYSYSVDKQPPSCLKTRHCHDKYEILYVVEGTGRFVVEGTPFEVNPGTLLLIKPLEYHSLTIDEGTAYERYVVHFSKEHLVNDANGLFDSILNGVDGSGKRFTSFELSKNVLPVFERFASADNLPENEKIVYIRSLLCELMVFLSVSGGEKIEINEGELGARVIKYLNENITKDMPLEKLARRFFVSKYYLCRAFKKHNGVSVHGYINHKRVMYAKQLIEQGETASSAAYKVGFGDYSAFYRAYVKIVGKAPTA